MRRRLQPLYERAKDSYVLSLGWSVPKSYRSSFVHWGGGVEAQHILAKLAATVPGRRMLIVGVMGGRDYFLFRNLGYSVQALDLGPQPDIEPITVANVEDELPYEDETFDVVLVGEVLEHLERDVAALRNIRRVLAADGRLIVTVPFFNDWEEGHTRVHSPESARRLLALGGFSVVDYVERPFLFRPNVLNPAQHAVSLFSYLARGRTTYAASGRFIGELSLRLGRIRLLGRLRRLSRGYGAYFLCRKGEVLDHVQLNRTLYTASED